MPKKIRRSKAERLVVEQTYDWLIDELGYSPQDILREFPMRVFSRRIAGWADIVVFRKSVSGVQRYTQANIFMIVECKEPYASEAKLQGGEEQLKQYLSGSQKVF